MEHYGHVIKPIFGNLKEQNLSYKDILTYITIRSFHNSVNKCCYPSYNEISKLSGLSIKVIKPSIKRLEEAGYLTVKEVAKNWAKRVYLFEYDNLFQDVSLQHLFHDDLSVNEKAFLLLILEYAMDDSYDSPKDISIKSGVSYGTCNQLFKSLRSKGYVEESVFFSQELNDYVAFISVSEEKGIYGDLDTFSGINRQSTERANGTLLLSRR